MASARRAREQQRQGSGAAIEIEDRLVAFQPGRVERRAVEDLGLTAVGLQERRGARLELEAEQALGDDAISEQQALGLSDRHVGARAIDEQGDGAHRGRQVGHCLRPVLEAGKLFRGRHQMDGAFVGVGKVAHDEVAHLAFVMSGMVRAPLPLAGEALGELDDVDGEPARQQAVLELEHPIERAALVESEARAIRTQGGS